MFLQQFQQNFNARSLDLDSIAHWLAGVGIVVLLLLLVWAIKKLRSRHTGYQTHGSVFGQKAIHAVFLEAFEQRRPFEVQLHADAGRRRPTLRCSPEYLGKVNLTVSVNGLESLSERWLERQVMVFFRVMLQKQFVYYTFASRITSIHQPRKGECHITLSAPDRLDNRQRRAFLRISPPHEYLLGCALWCGGHMPVPNHLPDFASWPRPRLLFIPRRIQQLQVLDLSAGGARIGISNQVLRRYKLRFNTGEQLILMLDLFNSDQGRSMRLWMACRVQNLWREHSSRDIQMGLQFLAWARPREAMDNEEGGGIEWLRLSVTNEVEELGNWIMRRHLELFRDSPAEREK